jgi:integrase
MKKGQRLQKNGHAIRTSTIDGYEILLKHLQCFQTNTQKTLYIKDWETLNMRTKKTETNYWKKFYIDFTDYMFHEKGHFDNYVGSNMKLLRAFFSWLKSELIVTPGPYYNRFYKTHEDIPVLVLSPERLHFLIYNKAFEKTLCKRLQKRKDLFVFGCTTALRFGDLANLKATNIEVIGKNTYVHIRSQKTNTFSRIYLPVYAKEILYKYRRRKTSLFPPISMTNFNKALKEIALLAGWTEEISKTRCKRGEAIAIYKDEATKQNYRFCDVVSSHIMRRTAITTMLRMGMNETNVRLISGHKPNSPSFFRYVYYADSFIEEEMDKIYAKFDAINDNSVVN